MPTENKQDCFGHGVLSSRLVSHLLLRRSLYRRVPNSHFVYTLESIIDVGQGINVGTGNFDKKNKRRALNKLRKVENIRSPWKKSKI
jgi:hypothetical protein